MKIKAAIFDLDGTIIDSMYIWEVAGVNYIKTLGIEMDEELGKKFKTMSMVQAAKFFIKEYNIPHTYEEILAGMKDVVIDFYRYEASIKGNVCELLSELKSQNIPMCVATATETELADTALTRCGVRHYFDAIYTCNDVGFTKSEPNVYHAAREFMGAEISDTWIFEDSFHAIQTAKKAGYNVIGIADEYEPYVDEIKDIADAYITDYLDALKVIF